MFCQIRLGSCRSPGLELWGNVDVLVEMIDVLKPNETVHLERIGCTLFHDGVEGETVDNITTEREITMPQGRGRRFAVFLFGQGADIGFRSGLR